MGDDFQMSCPVPLSDHATVQMAHGGGGRLMRELIEGLFRPAFAAEDGSPHPSPLPEGEWICSCVPSPRPSPGGRGGPNVASRPTSPAPNPSSPASNPQSLIPNPSALPPAHDSAVLSSASDRLAFTTDTFVVSPMFFPGGDIGKLAVVGTVNDLAMSGAKPAYLSVGFILEEGLPIATLRRVVESMREAAREVGVRIVTGDTKVVDRGKCDGMFINTSGIGWVPPGIEVSPTRVAPGDVILLSGDLGRHGMAIMSVREGLRFEGALESDCASLAGLVDAMLAAGADIHCLRDLTRGGLAAALNEIAADVGVGIEIDEAAIPVVEPVAAACEMLGLDPLYVANEGRLVAFVSSSSADRVLQIMREHPAAVGPVTIGVVTAEHAGIVEMRGRYGGGRIVDLLSGEQMPRIC